MCDVGPLLIHQSAQRSSSCEGVDGRRRISRTYERAGMNLAVVRPSRRKILRILGGYVPLILHGKVKNAMAFGYEKVACVKERGLRPGARVEELVNQQHR